MEIFPKSRGTFLEFEENWLDPVTFWWQIICQKTKGLGRGSAFLLSISIIT